MSRYVVSWTPDNNSVSLQSTAITTPITGLITPGRKYTVTITIYNDVTQVAVSRSVSTSKEQATSKFIVKNNNGND